MRRLVIVRHAKAQRAPGEDDFDRPLAPQGEADAALMGKVLADRGIVPDRVLVSAARRTQETWRSMQPAFPGAVAEMRRDLYLADALSLWNAVEEEEDAETLMVVAHNPGVHSLAVALIRRNGAGAFEIARMERGFPTATAAVFSIDEEGRPAWDGLYLAAEHGGSGGE